MVNDVAAGAIQIAMRATATPRKLRFTRRIVPDRRRVVKSILALCRSARVRSPVLWRSHLADQAVTTIASHRREPILEYQCGTCDWK
jgi:hypothetical protein